MRANHISDHQLGVLTDLEKALGMFSEPDKYSAGLAFFRALGYPMKFERTAVNESMFQFAYLTAKNHCVFSSDEMDAMRDVANISWLFTLDTGSEEFCNLRGIRIDGVQMRSVNYFCVELNCALKDRSLCASVLTKVISKIVNTPVIVLFCHRNEILLSSLLTMISSSVDDSRTYLSDWYLSYPIQDHVLLTLSSWYLGNYSDDDIYVFFMDWVHSMARSYLLYPENYEYIRFNRSSVASSVLLNDFDNSLKIGSDRYFLKIGSSEPHATREPREMYGYDYVSDDENVDILMDDDDWILDELSYVEELEGVSVDSDTVQDDVEGFFSDLEDSNVSNKKPLGKLWSSSVGINGIDKSVFRDPVRMLEYLELLERKSQ